MLTPDEQPRPQMAPAQRIGDVERERAVAALGEHYAAGRIDRLELEARLDAAYRATTVDQLVDLFGDLPDPRPFRLSRRQRRAADRAAARAARRAIPWPRFPVVPVVALLVAIAVLIASKGELFFLVPLLWFWLGAGRRRWYGPPHR